MSTTRELKSAYKRRDPRAIGSGYACWNCEGVGIIARQSLRGSGDVEEVCSTCDGTGVDDEKRHNYAELYPELVEALEIMYENYSRDAAEIHILGSPHVTLALATARYILDKCQEGGAP